MGTSVAAFLAGMVLVAQIGIAYVGSRHVSFSVGQQAGQTGQQAPSVTASSPPKRACEQDTLIGTLAAKTVTARRAPNPKARVIETFKRINPFGAAQVFDLDKQVVGTDGETWFHGLLPVRPNGTRGYLPGGSLLLSRTTYRLVLDRAHFKLRVFKGCDLLRTFSAGIGTGSTPTPVGRFYLASLLKLPDPDTIYGTYAYGLSGFSDVLKTWRFGGIIGLHGTNIPSSVGKTSSHGCIRLYNSAIEWLVRRLPLGTPIRIF